MRKELVVTTKVGTDRLDRSNDNVLFSLAELLCVNAAGITSSIFMRSRISCSGELRMKNDLKPRALIQLEIYDT